MGLGEELKPSHRYKDAPCCNVYIYIYRVAIVFKSLSSNSVKYHSPAKAVRATSQDVTRTSLLNEIEPSHSNSPIHDSHNLEP